MAGHRIYRTSVASVYPHYVRKAEKKGRTQQEVDEILCWLTGYGASELGAQLEQGNLDKLVDELARGKAMDKILRGP